MLFSFRATSPNGKLVETWEPWEYRGLLVGLGLLVDAPESAEG